MVKKLKLKEDQADIEELVSQFPFFLWVLRDFSLRLQDDENTKITPKQYLERAFKELNGNSSAVEQKNRIRRPLNYFFQERDCATMVRPTDEEWKLHKLGELD